MGVATQDEEVLPWGFWSHLAKALVEAQHAPGTRRKQIRGTGGREEPQQSPEGGQKELLNQTEESLASERKRFSGEVEVKARPSRLSQQQGGGQK